MGHHPQFGNLAKIRGIVFYRISPHELKAFCGFLNPGFKNLVRRFKNQVFRVGPPFVATYFIMEWANARNDFLSRKNPEDYKNDT